MATFEICIIIAFIVLVLFSCYQFFVIADELEKIWSYIEMILDESQRQEIEYKRTLKRMENYIGIDFDKTYKLRKDVGYYEKKDV